MAVSTSPRDGPKRGRPFGLKGRCRDRYATGLRPWLHGSGPGVTAFTNWHYALEQFSGDFYNIAPDVVGFGDSTHRAEAMPA